MTNIKKDIGRRIKAIRSGQKLTQIQIAKLLGVSPATISAWEIGDIGISIEAAIRVAKFANISLDWLLVGNEDTNRNCIEETETPEEMKLLEAYRKLGKTSQNAVLRVAEMMQK